MPQIAEEIVERPVTRERTIERFGPSISWDSLEATLPRGLFRRLRQRASEEEEEEEEEQDEIRCEGPRAWHPLDPSWVPFRGVPAPQIMEDVEVIQHVPFAVEQIVVCHCHRSCRYVEVEQLVRCTSHRCSSWTRLFVPVVVQ